MSHPANATMDYMATESKVIDIFIEQRHRSITFQFENEMSINIWTEASNSSPSFYTLVGDDIHDGYLDDILDETLNRVDVSNEQKLTRSKVRIITINYGDDKNISFVMCHYPENDEQCGRVNVEIEEMSDIEDNIDS